MDERIIERAKAYIHNLFKDNTDGHDANHSIRVYKNACKIAEGYPKSNLMVVSLASLLHDVDDHKLFNTENNMNARNFLQSQNVESDMIELICEVINGVSFSKNKGKHPESVEGKIVQDADRLDAIGAIGIARTFAYGGKKGRSLESSLQHFDDMVLSEQGKRVSKIDTYLNCAEVFAYRSTCIKRKYGAVIVKDDAVISTGYNGAPRGEENCCDIGYCPRIEKNLHQGQGYELCRAVHAEANALLNCAREQTLNADLYLSGVNPEDNTIHRAKPCPLCARMIIQAGIRNVYLRIGPNAGDYSVVPAKELEWVVE